MSDDDLSELERWVKHLEAFIGPGALPSLKASFNAGTSPGGAASDSAAPMLSEHDTARVKVQIKRLGGVAMNLPRDDEE